MTYKPGDYVYNLTELAGSCLDLPREAIRRCADDPVDVFEDNLRQRITSINQKRVIPSYLDTFGAVYGGGIAMCGVALGQRHKTRHDQT